MVELLINSDAQRQAFRDACLWATDIDLCLAWLAGGDAQGPSWSDLEPFLPKLRRAVVGLAHHRTDPALLKTLYDTSTLRLVPTTDEAFLANVHVFRREGRVRCLLGSAPFSWTSFHRSIEHLFVVEGTEEDPIVARALALVERGALAAHVPTLPELEKYKSSWEAVQKSGEDSGAGEHAAAELFDDALIGDLVEIPSPSPESRAAQARAIANLVGAATRVYPGARLSNSEPPGDLVHVGSLGLWAYLRPLPPQGAPWASFEIDTPPTLGDPDSTALSFADDGQSSFAREPGSGRVFLVHKDMELVGHRRCGVNLLAEGGGDGRLALVVGEVDAPDFPRHVAGLAREASAPSQRGSNFGLAGLALNGISGVASPPSSASSHDAVCAGSAILNKPISETVPSPASSSHALACPDLADNSSKDPPMACPSILHFSKNPAQLGTIIETQELPSLPREARRLAAEMSFVWGEVVHAIEGVAGPDAQILFQDLWDEQLPRVEVRTSYAIPGAKSFNEKAWLIMDMQPVPTLRGHRTALVFGVGNAAVTGNARREFTDGIASSLPEGTWDSNGEVFVPYKNIATRDRKTGRVDLAMVDLSELATDDLDEFICLALRAFDFGRTRAAELHPDFARFGKKD